MWVLNLNNKSSCRFYISLGMQSQAQVAADGDTQLLTSGSCNQTSLHQEKRDIETSLAVRKIIQA